MKPLPLLALLLLASPAIAQTAHPTPKPPAEVAPAVVRVWVNTRTGIWHYPGRRWYGATRYGRYMTEAEARGAGWMDRRL